MPERLRVSVVLCTYNGERFLQPQLDSLLAQRRLPHEIVIRDDQSTDRTVAVLERFALQAQARGIRVDLQRNPVNLGYRKNFEQALCAATGDVLFLCDQDDVWHDEKITRFLAAFVQRPQLQVLHCDARLIDDAGNPLDVTLFEAIEVTPNELARMHAGGAFEVLLRRNIATGAAMAIRRELLPRAVPFPTVGWVHDEWLAMVGSVLGEVDTLEAQLIDYRQHAGNQIGARKRSLLAKLSGVDMPRREFIAATAARIRTLDNHLQGLDDIEVRIRQDVHARLLHAQMRSNLPGPWAQRLPLVWKEYRHGHYHRFGSGFRSIVSDVLGLS